MRRCSTARATCWPTCESFAWPSTRGALARHRAGHRRSPRKHLQTYKIGRDVEIVDATADWTITSLIGPAAAELLASRRSHPSMPSTTPSVAGSRSSPSPLTWAST